MTDEMHLEIRRPYGNTLYYPMCKISRSMCAYSGTKTFSPRHVAILKDMGWVFHITERDK